MGWRDRVKSAGKRTKRFRVWRTDITDKPYECEGEYDTVEELNAPRWRLGWDYKIEVGRKFITRREFGDWVRSQGDVVARDKARVIDIKSRRNRV